MLHSESNTITHGTSEIPELVKELWEMVSVSKHNFVIQKKHQIWAVTSQALARFGLLGIKFGAHFFWIGASFKLAAKGYYSGNVKASG